MKGQLRRTTSTVILEHFPASISQAEFTLRHGLRPKGPASETRSCVSEDTNEEASVLHFFISHSTRAQSVQN